MDAFVGLAFLFVAICIVCTFVVVGLALLIGIIMLIGKLIVWMAYLGVVFIALALVSWIAVCSWQAFRDYFS